MRVLVLWSEEASANLGVRVLADGARTLATRVWPEATVEYLGFGRAANGLVVSRRELILGSTGIDRQLSRYLAGFDVVLDTGAGDSFTDIYGVGRLARMYYVSRLLRRLGVPVILLPQTIGPFRTPIGRQLARRMLTSAHRVLTRDSVSATVAERLGRPVDATLTDLVFALPSPVRSGPARDVLVNVSGLLWDPNPHVDHDAYRADVGRLVDAVLDLGRDVSLLPHVLDNPTRDNDVRILGEVRALVGPRLSDVVEPAGLDDVRSTLMSSRFVVGSRMHACLNAISVGTPAVPWAYSRKFAPLLGDVGWNHTVDLAKSPNPVEETLSAFAQEDQLREELKSVRQRADRHVAAMRGFLAEAK